MINDTYHFDVTIPNILREDPNDLPECYVRVWRYLAMASTLGLTDVGNVRDLAHRLDVDERTAVQALRDLRARGFIRTRRAGSVAARAARLWRRLRPWWRPRAVWVEFCGLVFNGGLRYWYEEWRADRRARRTTKRRR